MIYNFDKLILVTLAMCLGVGVPASTAASAMISEINGDDFKITRGNYPIKAYKLDILEAGDTVTILKDSNISLVIDAGQIYLDSKNTPYVIPDSEEKGIFDNASKLIISKFRDMLTRSSSSQVLISRGTNQAQNIKSTESETNRIPNTIKSLRLFFDHTSVSKVVLSGKYLKSPIEILLSGDMVGIPIGNLPIGQYSIAITPIFSEKKTELQVPISIVSVNDIPQRVKKVINTLESPVREQIAAILLSEIPGWKLASLQFAFDTNQFDILETILEMK